MPFTPEEIANINNSTLETYVDRGTVWKQDVVNKPMLAAINKKAGKFVGGKDNVSFAVGSQYGGGSLSGYSHDDQLNHYNPTGTKRVRFPWKEHFIGTQITMTELKTDGIDVIEDGSDQTTSAMSGREKQALANLLDEKTDKLGADYTLGLEGLVHEDGSSDVKAIAGIKSLIFDSPAVGSTGGLSRVANTWWRNRAATSAYAAAGGQDEITSSTANGGALIEFLDKEKRQLAKYRNGRSRWYWFAGSDFIDAYKKELRANGYYTQTGWRSSGAPDGSMDDPNHSGEPIVYDPYMDDNGMVKRCYVLDLGKGGIRLLYMDGQRMKKHNPARPYDRMVMYNGISMTGVMVAKQLNTSGVYDIA